MENHISEYIEDHIVIIDVTDHRIIWANPTFCRLKETSLEHLEDKTCYKVLKDLDHPCPVDESVCPVQSVHRSDKESDIISKSYSCIQIKDSKISPTEVAPIRSENGRLGRLVLYAKNMTALFNWEAKTYHEKEFRERILETTSSFVVTLDREGKITYFNAAARKISGYSLEEVIGQTWESLFGRIMDNGGHEGVYLITKDNRKRYMTWNNTFMKDAQRNTIGVVCIGQDITEREKAKRDLEMLHQFTQKVISRPTLTNITSQVFETIRDIFPEAETGFFLLNNTRDDFLPSIHSNGDNRAEEVLAQLIEVYGRESLIHWLRETSEPVIVNRTTLPSLKAGVFKSMKSDRHHWLLFPLVQERQGVGLLLIVLREGSGVSQENLRLVSTLMAYVTGPVVQAVQMEEQIQILKDHVRGRTFFMKLVGKSPEMQRVYDFIQDVAQSNVTVLVTGESGTGKELVAQAIHELSQRKDGPFVVANCAAYPSDLLESELFGHEKGAFTGAVRLKQGRFEQAHTGTLFLDEIGEASPTTQILLLRVLQDRRFERVGGEKTIETDVRIIAATNRDLYMAVREGKFREDLFYRLNVINIHLPPLRDRIDDIPLLCQHFIEKHNLLEKKKVSRISREAMEALMNYHWHGNVRELENVISRAVILAKGDSIEKDQMSLSVKSHQIPADVSLNETEKQLISRILHETDWNKQRTAKRLRISRSTLYSKIRKYHLVPPK